MGRLPILQVIERQTTFKTKKKTNGKKGDDKREEDTKGEDNEEEVEEERVIATIRTNLHHTTFLGRSKDVVNDVTI